MGFCIYTWTGPAVLTFSNDVIIAAAPPEKREWPCSQVSFRSQPGYYLNAMNFTHPALLVAQTFAGLDRDVRYVFRTESGKRLRVIPEGDAGFIMQLVNGRSPAQAAAFTGQLPGSVLIQPEIPPGTKTVSLQVIVQRGRMLEFFVEPPRIGKWRGYKAEERNRGHK